jgi:hypothetical protein
LGHGFIYSCVCGFAQDEIWLRRNFPEAALESSLMCRHEFRPIVSPPLVLYALGEKRRQRVQQKNPETNQQLSGNYEEQKVYRRANRNFLD